MDKRTIEGSFIYWYDEVVNRMPADRLLSKSEAILRHLDTYKDSSFIDSPIGRLIKRYAVKTLQNNNRKIRRHNERTAKAIETLTKLRNEK
jgi:hypothetical protein